MSHSTVRTVFSLILGFCGIELLGLSVLFLFGSNENFISACLCILGFVFILIASIVEVIQ